jgi:RHS repeat-associated protein
MRAFGEVASLGMEDRLRFPGQLHSQETGLYYNYHRDYAPQLGRYVQSDPIGLWGGMNIYDYSLQNPLKFFDYNGLAVKKILIRWFLCEAAGFTDDVVNGWRRWRRARCDEIRRNNLILAQISCESDKDDCYSGARQERIMYGEFSQKCLDKCLDKAEKECDKYKGWVFEEHKECRDDVGPDAFIITNCRIPRL